METGIVYQHRVSAGQLTADVTEVYRYTGYTKVALLNADKTVPRETAELVGRCITQMYSVLRPQAVYALFPLEISVADNDGSSQYVSAESLQSSTQNTLAGICSFSGYAVKSAYLTRNLRGCSRIILFAATLGPQVDALIRKSAKLDAACGAVMQASGAMFTESYVNLLNAKLASLAAADGFKLRPRYSPGYGDVSLEVQRIFFSLLACTQKIGLTLTDSLIMAPEKSVTAFIGMERIQTP